MRALRALLATAITAVLLIGAGWHGLGPASTPAAAAAEPEALVRITLTEMSPALPARDGDIRLAGTVTNSSDVELSNLQAIFWRSLDPIQTAEGMQAALASVANQPIGLRKVNVYQNIPSDTDRVLAPGESARFSLTMAVADLSLPEEDGIYLIGVHVRGRTVLNGPDITLGRARLFAPMVAEPPEATARLTTVVLLSSRPSLLRPGVLSDDHLAREVATGGRLDALLKAADRADTSFAVDPALIEELQTMRSGYLVAGRDDQTVPGTGQAAAASWLAGYSRLAQDRDGYRLLYGHPDAASLVRNQLGSVLGDSEAAAKAIGTTASLPLLAIPAGGVADAETVRALARLRPQAIVLDDASTQEARPLLTGPAGIPILNLAARSTGGGPGPDPRSTPVHLRQRTLAETWLEAATADPNDVLGSVRLLSSADQARADQSRIDAPWLSREPLDRLLTRTPAGWSGLYRYPDSAAERELSPAQLGGVRGLGRSYAALTDLLVAPQATQLQAKGALARSASSSWRGRLQPWRRYVDPQRDQVDATLRNGVTVIATPRVVTSAPSGGSFPITVRNTLPASGDGSEPDLNAVRVRLEFRSANAQRLTVKPLPPTEVAAASSYTANAQVEARSNGTVQVLAQAYTASGQAVGRPVVIEVKATQAGSIGWLIAITAGVVLVGTSALRIRQVARERAQAQTEPPAGSSALTSAPEQSLPAEVPPAERLDV